MARKKNKEALPDTDIRLTAEEMNLFDDESGDLFKFYIALSRRRDFTTGIVGEKTRINSQALKEAMSLTGTQGRKERQVSGGSITRWLERLEKLGLIMPLGNNIFKLPKAYAPESEKKKCDRTATDVRQNENQKTSIILDVKQENLKKCDGSATEVRTPLVDATNTIPTYLGAQNFFEMLGSFGFPVPYLIHKKTVDMINRWEKAGIAVEDAKNRIKSRITEDNELKRYPTYYQDIVLQPAQDLTGDVKSEQKRTKPRQQYNRPGRVTATSAFYDTLERSYADRLANGNDGND